MKEEVDDGRREERRRRVLSRGKREGKGKVGKMMKR